jgi:hypothetical protein
MASWLLFPLLGPLFAASMDAQVSGSQGEMGGSEKPDLSNGAAAAKMDRSYR